MRFLRELIRLCRPGQWYKNILIFIPLFFSYNILNGELWPPLLAGFMALIGISSVNYILNDYVDRKKDRLNPEKQQRPFAAGTVKIWQGLLLAGILLATIITFSYLLNKLFLIIVLVIFFLTLFYSFWLKELAFADLLAVSVNFVLRTISGSVLIQAQITPWIVVGIFCLALLLITGKRYGELAYLGERAARHRTVYKEYTLNMLNNLLTINATLLLISFAIFPFFSQYSQLILYLLPLFYYIILRYLFLIKNGSRIARHPHELYKDKYLTAVIIIFVVLSYLLIY